MTNSYESLVFAGTEWNDGATFYFDSEGAFDPGIAPKRFRWISGADSDGALSPDEAHYDNAEASVRIRVAKQADMDTALAKIGDLVKALQECEKQPLGSAAVWTPADSTKSLTMYVLAGEATGLPKVVNGDDAGWWLKSPVITLKLTRRPFLYGAEVTSAATVTDSNPYQTLTVASVTGDVDAEARLVITDAATQSRRHVEWGLEQRYYNASTALYIDSDNMVTSGFAGSQTTRTGAHDPGASGNTVIRATLTTSPVAVCGLGNLSHVGVFRVKARIYAAPTSDATADDFKVRLSWREGDGPLRSNDYGSPVVVNGWSEIDLGTITIPEKTLGTQRWTGQIEAYSEDPGDTLDVDYAQPIPAGEGYGKARAPITLQTITAFSARDEFDQTAGNLNGKTLPVGGTWATSGVATDFVVDAGTHTITRSVSGDTPYGRFAIASLAGFTAQLVQVDFSSASPVTGSAYSGVILRYVDAANWLAVLASAGGDVQLTEMVASSPTTISPDNWDGMSAGAWGTIRASAQTDGTLVIWVGQRGLLPTAPLFVTTRSSLATGGALASGKVGIIDYNLSGSSPTRSYDNFLAATSTLDAVVFSGRSAEIRHDGAQRADATGTYYGPIASYRGSRFYLPPAGSAGRTSRILVKTRRNDVDVAVDDQIADSTTATLHYTPRYYVAPR